MALRYPTMLMMVLVMCLAPLAQAEPSNRKTPRDAPSPRISWPLPLASAGAKLVYDVRSTSERSRGAQAYTIDGAWVQSIGADPEHEPHGGQVWSATDYRLQFSEHTPEEMRAMVTALTQATVGRELRLALDEDGAVSTLSNLPELAPVVRDIYNLTQDERMALRLAAIEDPSRRPAAEIAFKAARQRVAMLLASDEALAGLLVQLPTAYNFPGRGELPADETITYDDLGPNPLGGDPFPMLGSLRLSPPGPDGADVEMVWDLRLHPTRATPMLVALVEKVAGQSMSEDDLRRVPDTVDFSFVTRYRIDPATGAVRWMERTETRKMLDNTEVSVITFTLRDAT